MLINFGLRRKLSQLATIANEVIAKQPKAASLIPIEIDVRPFNIIISDNEEVPYVALAKYKRRSESIGSPTVVNQYLGCDRIIVSLYTVYTHAKAKKIKPETYLYTVMGYMISQINRGEDPSWCEERAC